MGVNIQDNAELIGFLKQHTKGTARALVKSSPVKGIGLEAWRQLHLQFNPQTLTSTVHAQQLEHHPKGASKMSEMPGALLEWEKNLQRCIQEGRVPPSDEWKRFYFC